MNEMADVLSITLFAPFVAAIVILLVPQRAKPAIRWVSLAG